MVRNFGAVVEGLVIGSLSGCRLGAHMGRRAWRGWRRRCWWWRTYGLGAISRLRGRSFSKLRGRVSSHHLGVADHQNLETTYPGGPNDCRIGTNQREIDMSLLGHLTEAVGLGDGSQPLRPIGYQDLHVRHPGTKHLRNHRIGTIVELHQDQGRLVGGHMLPASRWSLIMVPLHSLGTASADGRLRRHCRLKAPRLHFKR